MLVCVEREVLRELTHMIAEVGKSRIRTVGCILETKGRVSVTAWV